jgi:PAS domain S-box-containing protein
VTPTDRDESNAQLVRELEDTRAELAALKRSFGVEGITEPRRAADVLSFLARTSGGAAEESFFHALARYLSETLQMGFVCIDRLDGDGLTAHTLAVWSDGKFEDNVSYALADTPCGDVVGKTVCCFPASVCQYFPRDQVLQDLRAESYVGVTLWGQTGRPIGLIAVIGRSPLEDRSLAEATLKLVAVRAASELERLDAEGALRASQERFRVLVEWMPEASVVHRGGKIIHANPAAARLFGAESAQALEGKPILDLIHPDSRAVVLERVKTASQRGSPTLPLAEKYLRLDGTAIDVEVQGVPIRYDDGPAIYAVIRDIGERKRAEAQAASLQAQLHQAQKMESVGRLAGGVAHDFNNMLSAILANVDFALEQVSPTGQLREDLEQIRTAALHSADLTRQLLAFARKQTVSRKVVNLNDTLAGILSMLRRLIGEDVQLTLLPGEELWPVKVDPSQIDQILTNLCLNARDAIAGVGKLTVETGNVTLDADYCASHAECVPGDYVRLTVSDDGCGMDEETRSHLFEPFFTTKVMGKGTGLGLATVYGVVQQNHGSIEVQSEPGHGTTFKLYLPRHQSTPLPLTRDEVVALVTRGRETILLVEDEAAILKAAKRMLEQLGYVVLAANSAAEAVRLAKEHTGHLHLLMTDVIMPEMNGRDLAKNLLSLYPDLKRVFMSGYTADVIAHHGVLEDGVHFLQKPFSKADLAATLRRALDDDDAT